MAADARARLERHGYRVQLHRHVWVECWVSREGESWVGRGADDSAAFEDALSKMLPSHLARQLWASGAVPAAPSSLPRPMSGAYPRLVRASTAEPLTVSQSMAELRRLGQRITEVRDELALCAAERQRLAMLAWISEARAHTERFPEDTHVREAVAQLSRRLTETGKAYWPGSVTALQLNIEPKDLPRPMLGGPVGSWAEAADMAERALERAEASDRDHGRDPYGYAEEEDPPPEDPELLVDGVRRELEERFGPWSRGAEPERGRVTPDPESFARWTHRLRWSRRFTAQPDAWASAFGRLRWWGQRKQTGLGAATQGLDPVFVPPGGWGALVGGMHGARAPLPAPAPELQKALVVSNRRDPDEMRRLQASSGGIDWSWRIADGTLVESAQDELEGYDAVIGALGLQSTRVDRALSEACAAAGVRFVRVVAPETRRCLAALASSSH